MAKRRNLEENGKMSESEAKKGLPKKTIHEFELSEKGKGHDYN